MSTPPAASLADAQWMREQVVKMLIRAGSGHAGGSLGMADVIAVLYRDVVKHRPQQPQWAHRDRVVLSNGHICAVLYAALARHGYFPETELATFRQLDSDLAGHPHEKVSWGIETSSGPLGQGLSQAVGMALAARYLRSPHHIWCLTSDGEQQEGQVWEAYLSGHHYNLENLTVIVDRNYIQISGVTEQVMSLDSLPAKLQAFGWRVYEVNGHDHQEIKSVLTQARDDQAPSVVIAYTEPGKGVSQIEHKFSWHGFSPQGMDIKQALHELNSLDGQVETFHD